MSRIERFDDGLFRVEKAVVAAMLSVMGVVVFLDVIHRVSTRQGSLFASPIAVGAMATGVATLAFVTRGERRAPWKGLGAGLGLAVAQAVFIRVLPNGLVWSQVLALALTLWLGTIGASLAAHERRHLAMDLGSKIWPPSVAPKAAALGHVLTALFCAGVFLLAGRSVVAHWDNWAGTGGAGGNLSGSAIPLWTATLAIPYGMGVLAFRFGLEAWRTWTGRTPVGGDDTLHQLGIDVGESR
jgi:TRAP-type C4-dicarboxylate transport system permease small subunit